MNRNPWKPGLKLFFFNLMTFAATFGVAKAIAISPYTNTQWTYLLVGLIATVASILFWVKTSQKLSAAMKNIQVAAIGSSFYWLSAIASVVGSRVALATTNDPYEVVGLFLVGSLLFIPALLCFVIVAFSKGKTV